MHPTFATEAWEHRFRDEGVVTVDLLARPEVLALREVILDSPYAGDGRGCSSTTDSPDPELRRSLHELIVSTIGGPVMGHLVDHTPFTSSAVVKWPGDDSAMLGHRDWTFVDESRFRSLSFWMPLQDVDASNGGLRVVVGSHRGAPAIRTNPGLVGGTEGAPGGPEQDVPLSAGAAVAFDHAVFHGSPPNSTDEPRVALVLAVGPTRAGLVHHWRCADGKVQRYEITDVDFFRRCGHGVPPDGPGVRRAAEETA